MAIVKAKYLPSQRNGSAYATNATSYALGRDSERDNTEERTAFDGDRDSISAGEALKEIEDTKGKFYYHLILNAGDGETGVDLQDWTRDTMSNLENSLEEQGKADNLTWVAIEHDDHSNHDHIHVILVTDNRIDKDTLNDFREYTSESFDSRKDLLREFEQDMEKESTQQLSIDATVGQLLSVAPSQSVTIASGSEDDTNKPKKLKREKERGQDEGW